MNRGNTAALLAAAQRKSEAARARADAGIRALIKAHEPITFEAVAEAGHVSKDFLYRTPELRDRIVSLRARTAPQRAARPVEPVAGDSQSSVVRTLTAKLSEERTRHRTELAELQLALQAAHGELLRLRRLHDAETPGSVAGESYG
ncbi:DUF6262 family protein [Microbacterium lacticum]